jgi:hypothetical protein
MHSSENARRAHQRRPDLNINVLHSNSNSKPRDGALQTPPSRKPPVSSSNGKATSGAASRALRGPAPSPRYAEQDSFLENSTSFETDMSSKESSYTRESTPQPLSSDAHDLALSPRNVTRDSLMTTMLLSLDQFSMGGNGGAQYGTSSRTMYDDSFAGDEVSRTSTNPTRTTRGTGHAYTYSSDLEGADDSSRISSQNSRGRRSNSSSNFQSSLGRINSLRESSMRNQPGTSRPMHSRGGKGSKSSSSGSVDAGYVQVLSSQRWAQGFGTRSSSFDYGHRQPASPSVPQPQQQQPQQQQWHIEFSNTFFNEDYDAAPTPTVPAGPRRTAPPTPAAAVFTPPLDPTLEPKSPGLERKRSTRSAKSLVGRKAESKFSSTREAMPPVPSFDLESAPAPHVGYEKSKEAVHGGPTSTHGSLQTKERPGFFRRVFGGSSSRNGSASSMAQDSHASNNSSGHFSSPSIDTVDRPGSKPQHIASQMKPQSTPSSRDTSSSHSHHHVLQKKPSSFFRRRKKSINDDAPPVPTALPSPPPPPPPPLSAVPPIKLAAAKDKLSLKAEPSPVSSLRRVMNPYLKGSPISPGAPNPLSSHPIEYEAMVREETREDPVKQPQEYQREFSPDYQPSPNARIRSVEPELGVDELSFSEPEPQRRTDTPTRPPPEIPAASDEARNNSFLHLDGPSDAEESSPVRKRSPKEERVDESDGVSPERKSPKSKPREGNDNTLKIKRKAPRPPIPRVESDDDAVHKDNLALPIEGARSSSRASGSTDTNYRTAPSQPSSIPPSIQVEQSPKVLDTFEVISAKPLDEPEFIVGNPTEDDRAKAQKIFDGNEDFIQKEKAAAWMGEEGVVRQRTLRAYMDLHDFQNLSILNGLRQICGRLVFRAETQQVDRILVAFSKRWCDCNPNHGFKAIGECASISFHVIR